MRIGILRSTGRLKDLFKTSKGKHVAPAPIDDRLGMGAATAATAARPCAINPSD